MYGPSDNELMWLKLRMVAVGFLFLAGLNSASHLVLDCDIICMLKPLSYVLSVLILVSTLWLMFDRNMYLQFLGKSVYPCNSLAPRTPDGANLSVTVRVKPNAMVVYWASETNENEPVSNPWDAYKAFENYGVVRADSVGNAVLKVRKPSSYKVGLMGRVLMPHIHYRVCEYSGMMSEVKTLKL